MTRRMSRPIRSPSPRSAWDTELWGYFIGTDGGQIDMSAPAPATTLAKALLLRILASVLVIR
jgi:hypothetical protein